MPDFGDDVGQAAINVLGDIAKRMADPRYRAKVAKGQGGSSSHSGSTSNGNRAAAESSSAPSEDGSVDWGAVRGDAEFVPGQPDNAVLVIGPVPPGEMSPEQIAEAPTREMDVSGDPTAPIEGDQLTAPLGQTAPMPSVEGTPVFPAPETKADHDDGLEVADVRQDPRWVSDKEKALDALGQSPALLPIEEQKRQCEAFAKDLSRRLDDAGIDHAVYGPDDAGRWRVEMSPFDAPRAVDIVRGMGAEHDMGYVRNFSEFGKSAAYSLPAADERQASLYVEELAKRGIPAEALLRDDGASVVAKTNDAATLAEAAQEGYRRYRAGESPVSGSTVSELRSSQEKRGVTAENPPVSKEAARRRARQAKNPTQLRQRTREMAPANTVGPRAPKKVQSIGGR